VEWLLKRRWQNMILGQFSHTAIGGAFISDDASQNCCSFLRDVNATPLTPARRDDKTEGAICWF